MMYSQARLDCVRRRSEADAAARFRDAPRGEMRGGDGVLVRSIPKEAYFNAVTNHGVDPQDDGYWADMDRRYPHIQVPYKSRNPRVGAAGAGTGPGAGRLTRFGRVSFHKRYG